MIANFEGTVNATTLTCNITDEGFQLSTQWTLGNFGEGGSDLQSVTRAPVLFSISGDVTSDPRITFQNRLTILNLTYELDGVVVYCGTSEELQQANFTLKVYRKSIIQLIRNV